MKQCRMDCIHIDACRRFADNSTYWNSGDCPVYKPAADVAPKNDAVKDALIDLKRKIHDKAVYPHGSETYSYVNLKVFDAVLQNILNKYMEGSK